MSATGDLVIRPALPSEAGLVLQLVRELADYEKLSHEVKATPEQMSEALFPASGEPAAECLLAFAGGEAAGFALFFPTFSTFLAKRGLFLEDLFVRPHLRGRGIGTALISEVARIAAGRGCGRLEWFVLDWNSPAIRFYESLGARRLTEWNLCRIDPAQLRAPASRPPAPGGAA